MKDWVTLIHFQVKGTSWKIDLDDFVDEFDSRHDNRRISYIEVMMIQNSNVDCAGICMRIILFIVYLSESFQSCACFACGKTVINQRRVEKSAFEDQLEENSVWVLKWTTLLGIFCKISFTPAVTFCYQVHAPKTDTYIPTAALLCYLRCHWCRNLSEVNCIE